MMGAFTYTPDAATVAAAPPTLEPNHSDENVDPKNDRKHFAPSTPTRSTALHRRFLREVSMSPTPSISRTPSPTKGCERKESPTKEKLEVGKTGFYFSCELPLSKVSPRKETDSAGRNREMGERGGSPARKRDTPTPNGATKGTLDTGSPKKVAQRLETPRRGAKTPHQVGSAKGSTEKGITKVKTPVSEKSRGGKKATPARELFGTPLRNARTPKEMSAAKTSSHKPTNVAQPPIFVRKHNARNSPHAKALFTTPLRNVTTPKKTGSAGVSPTKSTNMASKFVKEFVPSSVLASRDTQRHVKDFGKEEAADNPHDTPSTTSLRPALNTTATENNHSKPVRKSSFDIGDLMIGLKAHAARPHGAVATVESIREQDVSGPPTPLRRAAEKFEAVTVVTICSDRLDSHKIKTPVADTVDPPEDLIAEACSEMPSRVQEQQLQYSPLVFPKPGLESEIKEEEASGPTQKHVNFQGSDLRSSDVPKRSCAKTSARTGTDPGLYHAMQQEMDTLKRSLGNSLGIGIEFSAKENTFELPAMANSLLESSRQKSTTNLPQWALVQTSSNVSNMSGSINSSTSMVRASMLMDQEQATSAPAPTKPGTACRLYSVKTTVHGPREKLHFSKDVGIVDLRAKIAIVGQQKVPARPSFKTTRSKVATPRRKPTATSSPTKGTLPQTAHTATRSKTSASPAKSKPSSSGIPRSGRKPVSNIRPTTNPVSTKKPLIPLSTTNRPASLSPDSPQPFTTTRPVFASATDIANRVAQWNTEDTKKVAPHSPSTTTPIKPKPKTNDKTSHTPQGSPAKSPVKPSRIIPPRIKPTTNLTPKRIAPKAPTTPIHQVVQRLRAPAPRTPTSRALDPNAFRTPSKEIETSLDQAIDRKIAEDKRGCASRVEGWKWVE